MKKFIRKIMWKMYIGGYYKIHLVHFYHIDRFYWHHEDYSKDLGDGVVEISVGTVSQRMLLPGKFKGREVWYKWGEIKPLFAYEFGQ